MSLTTPLFLTSKFRIEPLVATKNVWDFQLQEHFLNMADLYLARCQCSNHKHNKNPCIITNEKFCLKCKMPTSLLISALSLMYHNKDLLTKNLTKCCYHTHYPPCNKCVNCQINTECIVKTDFVCCASTGK